MTTNGNETMRQFLAATGLEAVRATLGQPVRALDAESRAEALSLGYVTEAGCLTPAGEQRLAALQNDYLRARPALRRAVRLNAQD